MRKFVYLPRGPRLARMFGTKNLAQIVQAHPGASTPSDSDMYDIHDSPAWKEAYSPDGIYGGDKRGISFRLYADGVNPFNVMCPIMMTLTFLL